MWPGVRASLPACKWRRLILEGGLQAVQADEDVVGTSRVRELERRVRELERLLGRKTMEVEILKEALDVNDPPASSQLNRLPSYLGLQPKLARSIGPALCTALQDNVEAPQKKASQSISTLVPSIQRLVLL